MPKTPEEFEAELAKMQGMIDGLRDQNKNLSEAHATLVTENATFKKAEEDRAKKERENLEAEVHSINKDYDCKGKSNEVIRAYMEGKREAQKEEPNVPDAPGIPHSTEGSTTDDFKKKKALAWFAGK